MEKILHFGGSYCCVSGTINQVNIDEDDFGGHWDHDPENAEDYCCGDMQFKSNPSTPEILEKYNISESEYAEICSDLYEGLSFGNCGWCE
jgi:hypothetical protein